MMIEQGSNPQRPLVLAIDDEARVLNFLRASLASQDYRVIEAANGATGLSLAASHVPDVILLDLGLPDMDGVDLLRKARVFSSVPVIVLSARGQERDKVDALDAGADDYLTKPFAVGELLARIRVALRRVANTVEGGPNEHDLFQIGELSVNLEKREVRVGDRQVHLTPIEYRLLTLMVQNAGRVLTHNFILREVWGPGSTERSEYVRVHMASLRRKIEKNPADPDFILTEVGVG
ncbi:MAG TPA: response regulator, partial [Spirochaetia bacterium]|nr:response regulator [Spirochaetia bacterium]